MGWIRLVAALLGGVLLGLILQRLWVKCRRHRRRAVRLNATVGPVNKRQEDA